MPYCADCDTPDNEEDMMMCSECQKWVCVDCYDDHMEEHDDEMQEYGDQDENYD